MKFSSNYSNQHALRMTESILEHVALRRWVWVLTVALLLFASVIQYASFGVPAGVVALSLTFLLLTAILLPFVSRLETPSIALFVIAGSWAFGSLGMLATGGVQSPLVWTLGVVIVFAGLIAQSRGLLFSCRFTRLSSWIRVPTLFLTYNEVMSVGSLRD